MTAEARGQLTSTSLFIRERFLDLGSCEACCDALRRGQSEQATIANASGQTVVDQGVRRTRRVSIDWEIQKLIRQPLEALMSEIQRYFTVSLVRLEQTDFLLYGQGDFFRPHQDHSRLDAHGSDLRLRTVSAVLFLNRQTRLPAEGCYCGGEFRLYTPQNRSTPYIQIDGEPGLLIAFPSDTFHEVRPVRHGERCTVAAWYVRADANPDS